MISSDLTMTFFFLTGVLAAQVASINGLGMVLFLSFIKVIDANLTVLTIHYLKHFISLLGNYIEALFLTKYR